MVLYGAPATQNVCKVTIALSFHAAAWYFDD